jgi:NAD/NADP transhydrogenase beta subunit
MLEVLWEDRSVGMHPGPRFALASLTLPVFVGFVVVAATQAVTPPVIVASLVLSVGLAGVVVFFNERWVHERLQQLGAGDDRSRLVELAHAVRIGAIPDDERVREVFAEEVARQRRSFRQLLALAPPATVVLFAAVARIAEMVDYEWWTAVPVALAHASGQILLARERVALLDRTQQELDALAHGELRLPPRMVDLTAPSFVPDLTRPAPDQPTG